MEIKLLGLRGALGRNRLQQKHVAEALGVSHQSVNNWVSCRVSPRGRHLLALISFLQKYEPSITTEQLFSVEIA